MSFTYPTFKDALIRSRCEGNLQSTLANLSWRDLFVTNTGRDVAKRLVTALIEQQIGQEEGVSFHALFPLEAHFCQRSMFCHKSSSNAAGRSYSLAMSYFTKPRRVCARPRDQRTSLSVMRLLLRHYGKSSRTTRVNLADSNPTGYTHVPVQPCSLTFKTSLVDSELFGTHLVRSSSLCGRHSASTRKTRLMTLCGKVATPTTRGKYF